MSRRQYTSIASEEDNVLRASIAGYSKSTILPKVAEMDHLGRMDRDVVTSLFEQVCFCMKNEN